jgi:outer membrane protein assembly factor BamB
MKAVRTFFLVSVSILITNGCTSHLNDNNWPQFRGLNSLGIAPVSSFPPTEVKTEKNLSWKIQVAYGLSSPCIANEKIFITGFNTSDSTLITYCIDQLKGTLIWEKKVIPDTLEKIHTIGSHATPTPFTDGKFVYIYFGAYGVICYDMEGNLSWEKRLPVLDAQYGSNGSPVVYDSLLILNRVARNSPAVLALNKKNGNKIWESQLENTMIGTISANISQSTPVIWNDQIILHRSFQVISLNLKDGKQSWKIETGSTGNSTPIIINDTLYVNCWYNFGNTDLFDSIPEFKAMLRKYDSNRNGLINLNEIPADMAMFKRPELNIPTRDTLIPVSGWASGFDANKDKALNEKEWGNFRAYQLSFLKDHALLALKLNPEKTSESPIVLWTEKENIAEVPSLLKVNNQIYMITNGGIVTCLDSKTGKLIFRDRLGAPGAYISSPILAGKNIYFASYNGRITVIKPGEKLDVVSQSTLKGKIGASIVALDKYLYVRTDSALFSFKN